MKLEDRMATSDPDGPALAELGDWLFSAGGDELAKVRTAREAFTRFFQPSPALSGQEEDRIEAFGTLVDGFSRNAELDRAAVDGSIRNGGLLIDTPRATHERYYVFSVAESGTPRQVLRPGYVHLLEREGFVTSDAPVRFDEWHRQEPVRVVKRLPVSTEDFLFRDAIARHPDEPTSATGWNYRKRISAL